MPQPTALQPVDLAAVADVLDRLVLWVRRAAPSRMSSTSVTTLNSLAYSGPQRVTDLAVQQSVAQPSMTTLVNRLCHEGYAERLPNPQDGRSMLVGVTTEGRRVLGERHAERAAVLEQVIGGLPTEQQSALGDLVAPLRALTHQTPSHESSHL